MCVLDQKIRPQVEKKLSKEFGFGKKKQCLEMLIRRHYLLHCLRLSCNQVTMEIQKSTKRPLDDFFHVHTNK